LVAGTQKDQDWLLEHFRSQANVSEMQSIQEAALAKAVQKMDPNFKDAIAYAPDLAVKGAQIIQTRRCTTCHVINKEGNSIGPTLNGIVRRRTAEWVTLRLRDPKAVTPGTIMPPTKLSPQQERELIAYLFSLQP
jgi:cytochrome c2